MAERAGRWRRAREDVGGDLSTEAVVAGDLLPANVESGAGGEEPYDTGRCLGSCRLFGSGGEPLLDRAGVEGPPPVDDAGNVTFKPGDGVSREAEGPGQEKGDREVDEKVARVVRAEAVEVLARDLGYDLSGGGGTGEERTDESEGDGSAARGGMRCRTGLAPLDPVMEDLIARSPGPEA